MGVSSQKCLLLPLSIHNVHVKDSDFVVLQKTSKHDLISIYLPQRKGEMVTSPE